MNELKEMNDLIQSTKRFRDSVSIDEFSNNLTKLYSIAGRMLEKIGVVPTDSLGVLVVHIIKTGKTVLSVSKNEHIKYKEILEKLLNVYEIDFNIKFTKRGDLQYIVKK